MLRAQYSDSKTSALIASASLASNYVRLFGPGKEAGDNPILAPKRSSDWDTTSKFLGFVVDSSSVPEKKARAIETAFVDDWLRTRRRHHQPNRKSRGVLSLVSLACLWMASAELAEILRD